MAVGCVWLHIINRNRSSLNGNLASASLPKHSPLEHAASTLPSLTHRQLTVELQHEHRAPPVSNDQVHSIAALLVAETGARLAERRIRLEVAPCLLEHLCAAGFDQVGR